MLLEICANSYQSAMNAQEAEAHRIELCTELSLGGLTPSYGLLNQVMNELTIPVFVLIRPRSGNFVYSDGEFEIMKQDIRLCKDLGCEGIVSGVLYEDNTIDYLRTQSLVELSKPLEFTFHRAFDCIENPIEALEQLIDLGVHRILTSGLESSAERGLDLLKQLKEQAKDKITILPGSGISAINVTLFKEAGFSEIHTSASKVIWKETKKTMFDAIKKESDITTIKAILNSMKDEA